MSVYVDSVNLPFRGKLYCHMFADSTDELDEMADKIMLKRSWIQNAGTMYEHYDVSPHKKELAIKNGAIEINLKQAIELIHKKRNEKPTDEVMRG